MGIGTVQTLGKTDGLHQFQNALLNSLLFGQDLVVDDGLGNRLTHRLTGIQRRERILEDQLHIAALLPHLFLAQSGDIGAVENDLAAGGLHQAQNGTAGGGLTAAGLADNTEGLALLDGKGDIIHRVQHAVGGLEILL